MKIIVADDHLLFRQGLRTLLELNADNQLVSEVNNTADLLTDVAKFKPDLVVQDFQMPAGSGIETLSNIKKYFPEIKVIILTGGLSSNLFNQLIRAKADGILFKEISAELLLQAVNDVMKGVRVLSPVNQQKFASEQPQLISQIL